MVTATVYNNAKKKFMTASIDLVNDTIKLALTTSSYPPNIDTDTFFSDITNEVSGSGYSAGGAALTTKSVTVDTTNDLAYFDADDTTWAASTITARYGVLYKSTGVAGTSPLIGYIDFATNKISSGDTFTITWATTGIFKIA
jgi:hypothetical protein